MLEKAIGGGDRRRTGVLIAAVTAIVSGIAVFVNGYGVRAWAGVADATTYTTLKNLVAAVVLLTLAVVATRRNLASRVVKPRGLAQWGGLAVVAVIGGAVPFVLFFEGFSRVASTQAAFIHKTLVIWVVILAVILLREKIGFMHVAAVALLVFGQAALVGGLDKLSFGTGEWMMLAATLFWSVEVIVAKRLLRDLTPLTVGVARMAGGAALLIAYGIARGAFSEIAGLSARHVMWILLTGLVLAAYVGSWYAALARAQAVDVTAVLVGGALITAMLRWGVDGAALPSGAGLGLVAGGVAVALIAGWRLPRAARSS